MEPNLNIHEILNTQVAKSTLVPVGEAFGEGLGNLIQLVFMPIKKARQKKEFELNIFLDNLKKNIESIPSEKLIEPPLHIVGPALEAAKYYYEEPELRDMFAKLISTSMNCDTTQDALPSFIEIIKQLSPLDAKVFQALISNTYGVISINYGTTNRSSYKIIYEHFFPFEFMDIHNYSQISVSISNLIRLGLIHTTSGLSFEDKSIYEKVYEHPVYIYLKNSYARQVGSIVKELFHNDEVWDITPYGKSFAESCLSDVEEP